jgi:RNA recognition motif-containing protein
MGADDARKLFVGGLSDSVTEQDLRAIFEGAGLGVVDVNVPRDRDSGRPRGFGFVTLSTVDAVDVARSKLDGSIQAGRAMSVRRFAQDAQRRAPAERPARADDRTVFLGKLPYDATADEIGALFQQYDAGTVERVTLPLAPDGRPRGFGFVTLESPDAAALALERLSRAQLRGRQLVVTAAQPRGRGEGGAPASRSAGASREGGPFRESGSFRDSGASREGLGHGPGPRTEGGRPPPQARGPRFDTGRHEPGRYDAGRHEAARDAAPYFPPHSQREERGDFSEDEPVLDTEFRETSGSAEGEERRPDSNRQRGKEKKKAPRTAEKSNRRERGGGGNWQRWDTDED